VILNIGFESKLLVAIFCPMCIILRVLSFVNATIN